MEGTDESTGPWNSLEKLPHSRISWVVFKNKMKKIAFQKTLFLTGLSPVAL